MRTRLLASVTCRTAAALLAATAMLLPVSATSAATAPQYPVSSSLLTSTPATTAAVLSTEVLARVMRVHSRAITVQPLSGDPATMALWDVSIAVSKGFKATLPDGSTVPLTKVRRGSVVRMRLKGEVATQTSSGGCGLQVNGTFGCGFLADPAESTTFKGTVVSVVNLGGTCTSKRPVLGGSGERVLVNVCRYREGSGEGYVVSVNASDAEHTEDVIKNLATTGEVRISQVAPAGVTVSARFKTQGRYASAALPAAGIPSGSRVRVEIWMDGPHDGKPVRGFTVSSSTKL